MTVGRACKVLTLFLLLLCAGWIAGFVCYVDSVSSYVEPVIDESIEPTEAIVVLTGGSERLPAGLNLLRAGKAKKLLVSGVHPGIKLGSLLAHEQADAELKECCIVLGHEADNTLGNAVEASAFMRQEHFSSLRLVTANYHMARSLLLFGDAMPSIKIIPHPVLPDSVDMDFWWRKPGTLSLLSFEYTKLIFAWVRSLVGVDYA